MKVILSEYGRTVTVIVAVISLLVLLLVHFDFFDVLGSVADVNSNIVHDKGENAMDAVNNRVRPTSDFTGVNKHVYKNQVFRPMAGVVFKDANGIACEVVITSILYQSSDGVPKELVSYYNRTDDVLVLNASHYSASHEKCSASEFTDKGDGKLVTDAEEDMNHQGIVTVTYRATDDENQVTVEKVSFVIDSKSL